MTRQQTAAHLLERLQRGPNLGTRAADTMTVAEAQSRVRAWLESWITPEVVRLVPELRRADR